jgi:Trypsin
MGAPNGWTGSMQLSPLSSCKSNGNFPPKTQFVAAMGSIFKGIFVNVAFLLTAECGRIDSRQTILFGDQGYNVKVSDANEWPWIAKIQHPNQPNRSECHGVLIDHQHILTASTCVTKYISFNILPNILRCHAINSCFVYFSHYSFAAEFNLPI